MTDAKIDELLAELDDEDGLLCEDAAALIRELRDDAQAMALVKKFELGVLRNDGLWEVVCGLTWGRSIDLNRAIRECVAKMQKAKTK